MRFVPFGRRFVGLGLPMLCAGACLLATDGAARESLHADETYADCRLALAQVARGASGEARGDYRQAGAAFEAALDARLGRKGTKALLAQRKRAIRAEQGSGEERARFEAEMRMIAKQHCLPLSTKLR